MPEAVVVAIVDAAAAIFTTATLTDVLVATAFSLVTSAIFAPGTPTLTVKDLERTHVLRSSISPHRTIYGNNVVGGTLVYGAVTTGNVEFDNEYWDANGSLNEVFITTETGPNAQNVGNGAYTFETTEATAPGTYVLICTAIAPNAGTFELWSALGAFIGTVVAGAGPTTLAGLVITIGDGDVDWAIDDGWIFDMGSSAVVPADTTNKYLHLVIAVAGHEVDEIGSVFFNDTEILASERSPQGMVVEGEYANPAHVGTLSPQHAVVIRTHLGATDQWADALLVASIPEWTTAHQLKGRAYIYIRLRQDLNLWPTGIPAMKFQIKGKRLYDPRDGGQNQADSSTWIWADNPALSALDYLRSRLKAPDEEIDFASFAASASVCDEDVVVDDIGTTQKRYTCNGTFTADAPVLDVLETLTTAYAGATVWQMGLWSSSPGAAAAPTFSLTEDDFRGPISYQVKPGRDQRFNTIRGTFFDPTDNWQETDFPEVSNPLYVTEDGGEVLIKDIHLPYCADAMEAQRAASIDLETGRQGLVASLPLKLSSAIALRVWQVGGITLAPLGWDDKLFRIRSWTLDTDDDGAVGVDVVVQEYSDTVFDWLYSQALTSDPAPNTNLLDPREVPIPSGLVTAAGQAELQITGSGTLIVRMKIEWADPGSSMVESTEVQYKLSADTEWRIAAPVPEGVTATWLVDVLEGSDYDVRIRHVNLFRAKSPWVMVTNQNIIGKTAPPTDVVVLNAATTRSGVKLDWDPVPDVDIREYLVKRGADWASASKVFCGRALDCIDPYPGSGTMTYWIKAIDTTGHESINATSVGVTVDAPGTPIMSHVFTTAGYEVTWSNGAGSFAVDYYELRRGTTWETGEVLQRVSGDAVVLEAIGLSDDLMVAGFDVASNMSPVGSLHIDILPPEAPAVTTAFVGPDVRFQWTESPGTFEIQYYELRKGISWATAEFETQIAGTTFSLRPDSLGETYLIAAIDAAGNVGAVATTGYAIAPPSATAPQATVIDNNVMLKWTVTAGSLPIAETEVRRGDTWATAEVLGVHAGTFAVVFEALEGQYTYWVAPIDSSGNYGQEQSRTTSVNPPPDYLLRQLWDSELRGDLHHGYNAGLKAFGSDFEGNEIGYWVANANVAITPGDPGLLVLGKTGIFTSTDAAPTTSGSTSGVHLKIPYAQSEAQFSGNTVRIRLYARPASGNAASNFDIAYSTNGDGDSGLLTSGAMTAGVWEWHEFTYAVPAGATTAEHYLAIWGDSAAGGLGTEIAHVIISVVETGKAGPLFVLAQPFQRWQDHFLENGWADLEAQEIAGYPEYLLPSIDGSLMEARYDEVFDYGTTIPATKITIDADYSAISGNPTLTPRIHVSNDGVNFTSLGDVWQAIGADFRYVKAQLLVEQETGKRDGIVQVDGFTVRLDIKQKTAAGTATAVAADAAGTTVTFASVGAIFLDVESIVVSPMTTSAVYAVVDFNDVANPTEFKVLLFDTNGTRVDGQVSWTARGY